MLKEYLRWGKRNVPLKRRFPKFHFIGDLSNHTQETACATSFLKAVRGLGSIGRGGLEESSPRVVLNAVAAHGGGAVGRVKATGTRLRIGLHGSYSPQEMESLQHPLCIRD